MKISKSDPVQQWDTDRFCLGPSFNADRRLFRLYLRDFKGPQMSVLSRTSSNRLSTQSNLNGLFLGDSGGAKKKKTSYHLLPSIHPRLIICDSQGREAQASRQKKLQKSVTHQPFFPCKLFPLFFTFIIHPSIHHGHPSLTLCPLHSQRFIISWAPSKLHHTNPCLNKSSQAGGHAATFNTWKVFKSAWTWNQFPLSFQTHDGFRNHTCGLRQTEVALGQSPWQEQHLSCGLGGRLSAAEACSITLRFFKRYCSCWTDPDKKPLWS